MHDYHQDDLLEYYQRELTYLREQGNEFAQRYPRLASRLHVGENSASTDPHVERLLESFAFLTGRIQYNIDREFSEIPSALLDVLYPHLQTPIPSLAIARFELDLDNTTSQVVIDRHTQLLARTEEGPVCRFRTCYPVTLWPLEVKAAQLTQD